MKEYAVLTQKDKIFGGKFNPEKIQDALNEKAAEGWSLRAAVTARFALAFGNERDELIMFLERDKP